MKHVHFSDALKSIFSYAGPILILLLFLVIPFNIAYHFNNAFAYVDGYFVNYLDFVVHIVDLAIVGVTVWGVVFGHALRSPAVRIVCAAAILLWLLQNTFFSDPVVLYTSTRLALYAVGIGVAMMSLVIHLHEDDGKRSGAVAAVVTVASGTAVVQSVIAVMQFTLNHTLGLNAIGESIVQVGGANASSVFLPGDVHLRGYGTFPHPNVLGGYLVASLFVVLAGLLSSINWAKGMASWKKRIIKWCWSAAAAVICLGIGATWSRTAWVAGALVVVVMVGKWMWQSGKQPFKWYCLGVALCVAVLSLWVFMGADTVSSAIRERVIEQSSASDVSVRERRELAGRAYNLVRMHPLFGVGAGKFIPSVSDDPVVSENGIRVMQPVHNVPLLILAETGLVGIAVLGTAVFFLFRHTSLSVELLLAAAVTLMIALADHYLWTLPQGMMVVFLFLLAAVIARNSHRT